jgi:hypothetical protein
MRAQFAVYLNYDLNGVGYTDDSGRKRKALHPDEIRRVEQVCAAKYGAQYDLQGHSLAPGFRRRGVSTTKL